jgi:hypothetical protein
MAKGGITRRQKNISRLLEREEEARIGQAKKGQERKGEGQTEIARRFAHENLQEMFPEI